MLRQLVVTSFVTLALALALALQHLALAARSTSVEVARGSGYCLDVYPKSKVGSTICPRR